MNNQQELCPCGSGAALRNCCLPFIKGQSNAPGAEVLMRSRYVAYCLNEEQYLLESWHVSTRPASVKAALEVSSGSQYSDLRCTPSITPSPARIHYWQVVEWTLLIGDVTTS